MPHMAEVFWLCFVPFFVAMDPLGMVPIFVALTEGLPRDQVRRVILQSLVTAAAVALIFLAAGLGLMNLLGISVADFMVAGGVLLFVLALSDLIRTTTSRATLDPESLGAVPLGVPLITGPAVLTTSVIITQQHGAPMTAMAILLNIGLMGLVLTNADRLFRLLGKAGSKALSKIFSLLLSAIAVMIVRRGIALYVEGGLRP